MKFITGIWQDSRGNRAAWGKLHAKLSEDALVTNTSQVAPREVEFALDQRGALKSSARIWANDELSPSGTYYTLVVTEFGGGVIWGPVNLVLSGQDPINITSLVPISAIPPTDVNASLSVVTSPTLVAGVLSGSITGPTGVSTNLVTVSDQIVFAPAGNISLLGSQSGQSLSLTISGYSSSNPIFTGGLDGGNTMGVSGGVTNALYLAGGPNITLSGSTNLMGMTISISGHSQATSQTSATIPPSTSGGLSLQAGSNITFSRSIDLSGNQTITINGPFPPEASAPFMLVGGSNVSLQSSTNGGTTVTINAIGGGTGGGAAFSAGISGGNTVGISGTVANRFLLAGGYNIVLSGSTDANGMTASISNPYHLIAGITGSALSSGQVDRLFLAAGSNITLASGSSQMGTAVAGIITIDGAAGGTGGAANPFSMVIGGAGGTQMGYSGPWMNRVMLQAGSNIVLYGGATGGTSGLIGITARGLSLVGGSNISLSTASGDWGTTATVNVTGIGTGGGGGATYGISQAGIETGGVGTVTGNIGATQTGQLRFVAGSNILLSQATIQGGVMGPVITINAAGATGGAGAFSLFTGSNISFSTSGSSTTIINVMSTAQFNVGNTTNSIGSANGPGVQAVNRLYFAAGSNVSLSSNAAAGYGYLTIHASGVGGGGGGISQAGVETGGAGTVSGTLGATQTGQLRFVAGSNILLSQATLQGGVTGPIITINALATAGSGANFSLVIASAAGGSIQGYTGPWSNKVMLEAGPNILLYGGATNNTSGLIGITARQLSVAEGSNITLSTASNSAGTTASIYAPAGATGGGGGDFSLIPGSNISFSTSGSTTTINSPATTAFFYIGNTTGVGSGNGPAVQIGNRLYFSPGSNISLSSNMGANYVYLTINALPPVLSLAAGMNVNLASTTAASGSTVTINAIGGGTGGFVIRVHDDSVSDNWSFFNNGLDIYAGSNVRFSFGSVDVGAGFLSIHAIVPGTASLMDELREMRGLVSRLSGSLVALERRLH